MSERAWHRARLFLRAVLPLVAVAPGRRGGLARGLAPATGAVRFAGPDPSLQALLRFEGGQSRVLPPEAAPQAPADLTFRFRDLGQMNDFFAGKPAVPAVHPWLGLRSPRLLAATVQALLSLRVLEPKPAEVLARESPEERALRVRLLLYLVTASLAQLHQDGFPELLALSRGSPDRVYQWTVEGTDIATFVRMREGRFRAGRGVYGHRKPFVHFVFRDLDAAHAVLTAQGSQMTGFRGGLIATHGSPEYARKVGLLMQRIDELLMEG
jgi:hypothetical protein